MVSRILSVALPWGLIFILLRLVTFANRQNWRLRKIANKKKIMVWWVCTRKHNFSKLCQRIYSVMCEFYVPASGWEPFWCLAYSGAGSHCHADQEGSPEVVYDKEWAGGRRMKGRRKDLLVQGSSKYKLMEVCSDMFRIISFPSPQSHRINVMWQWATGNKGSDTGGADHEGLCVMCFKAWMLPWMS